MANIGAAEDSGVLLASRYVGNTGFVQAGDAHDWASVGLFYDTYSLAAYQVEVDGLGAAGSDQGLAADGETYDWMLTHYHRGESGYDAQGKRITDSDVASTDRTGHVDFRNDGTAAAGNGRLGCIVSDQASVTPAKEGVRRAYRQLWHR